MTWTGQRLRDARARQGWTQAELAEHLGAAPRSVASWERGEAKPQAHWITKLDDLFARDTHTDPTERLDQHTIERALDEASFLDLLAAIARNHARTTKHGGEAPELPAGRYVLHTEDAPSTRRRRDHSPQADQPDEPSGGQVL